MTENKNAMCTVYLCASKRISQKNNSSLISITLRDQLLSLNTHLYRIVQLLSKPPSPFFASTTSSSCFQMLSFEAMMPHLSYVSKERPCSALLNYWILLMPAPVGQEEEQVGGSQCDQSTWNIQLWIYTSFTDDAAAAAVLVLGTAPHQKKAQILQIAL